MGSVIQNKDFLKLKNGGNIVKHTKSLSVVLVCVLMLLVTSPVSAADTGVTFDALYAQTFNYVNSLSSDSYIFDCITFVLTPEATAAEVEITADSLGITDNCTVERIFAPGEWNTDANLEEQDIMLYGCPQHCVALLPMC